MFAAQRERLRQIKAFPSLVTYLRDDLDWPIESEDFDDLTFDYEAKELGIDSKTAAKIEAIKQLRPLTSAQPWGIFFIKFEPKRLPVVALRRILSRLVIKKRASASRPDQQTWNRHDLLFISNYGEGEQRQITFAHFREDPGSGGLPALKVLGWDYADTALHIDHAHETLQAKLRWPDDEEDLDTWRETWSSAFTVRHREVITTSRDLAIQLADLARCIRERANTVLAMESEQGPLRVLMAGFKTALIHDLTDDDFADMYAQTISYGLLSARVSRPAGLIADNLADMIPITNPFLKDLMTTFVNIGGRKWSESEGRLTGIDFDELGINDVVDLLRGTNMEAVLREFGREKPEEDPVIHFYELFLKEYDAKKRMQRGVFYTPKPVVSFIVRSVDELLRTEFGLRDGLADTATWGEMAKRHESFRIPNGTVPEEPFIQILDPATGTGTFLVEVIDFINRTMTDKWAAEGHRGSEIDRRWNDYVPRHLLPRLYGYELMMAPYAIAHMKLGLKLFETGYRFGSDERARVYLTNALEPVQDYSDRLEFAVPALAHEAKAVNAIKRSQHFTVVVGNPPYSIHSGNLSPAARSLVDRYRICAGQAIVERGALQFEKNLQNDYVKFLRLGEKLINDVGTGILGYITSHAYLTNRTLRGMRDSLLHSFDRMFVYNLHGNAASGEAAALVDNDENVFEITEGVAISVFLRRHAPSEQPTINYSDLVGDRNSKYATLSSSSTSSVTWRQASPELPNLILKPQAPVGGELKSAFSLSDIFVQFSAGIITARDKFATDENLERLAQRVENFATSDLCGDDLLKEFSIKSKKGWDVDSAKSQAQAEMPIRNLIKPLLYRPFDSRFIAYCKGIVWGMAFPTLRHTLDGRNYALIGMKQYQYDVPEYCYVFVSRGLTDHRICVSKVGVASLFPLYLNADNASLSDLSSHDCNFAPSFTRKVTEALQLNWLNRGTGDLLPGGSVGPEDLFQYIYAQLHSHSYRVRYAEFLRSDYPHIFVTADLELFSDLVTLGRELVALHVMESTRIDEYLTTVVGEAEIRVEKVSYSEQTVWLDKAKTKGFKGVPQEVWDFRIGGYQVCEKWLKDRQTKGGKNPRVGRVLSDENIVHYQRIIVAINETIRLMDEIDRVIDEHGGWPNAFAIDNSD